MLKRPKAGETEDDLLRFQEEFLASRATPAAKLIKVDQGNVAAPLPSSDGGAQTSGDVEMVEQQQQQLPERDVVSISGLPSTFSHTTTSHPKPRAPPIKKKPSVTVEDCPEEYMDVHDTHITKVLTEIVERDLTTSVPVYYPTAPLHGGFPRVLHRGDIEQEGTSDSNQNPKKKKSLFAQQFAKKSAKAFGVNPTHTATKQPPPMPGKDPVSKNVRERKPLEANTKSILSGSGLDPNLATEQVEEIHQENLSKIQEMTTEEIAAERKQLLEMLDPSMVTFLKNRRKQTESPANSSQHIPMEVTSSNVTEETIKSTHIKVNDDSKATPIDLNKKWVHMDKIEYEKLEWMKDLPPPKTGDSQTGKVARFDFKGKVVGTEEDVPTHLGLHHHGDEPERAGYSLEELFTLARSSNLQQRTLALNILHNIIGNARHGEFAECTSTALLPALLEGGLLFIVRWAMDDTTENPLAAAIACLHAILVCQEDEDGADQTFSWYLGSHTPALKPQENTDNADNGDEAAPEETKKSDADLLKEDIIMGVVRMSLLPRIRYLLTTWRPVASVVVNLLQILIRIARHSAEAAYQITLCNGLLETIVKEFLPTTWNAAGGMLSNNYGSPVSEAMKLLRVICSAGRHMAAAVVKDFDIMTKIVRYTSESPCSLQLHPSEAEAIYVESFRTWHVLVSYGLCTDHYRELYDVLIQKVQRLALLTYSSHDTDLNQAVAMMGLLEMLVSTAAVTTTTARQQLQKHAKVSKAVPDINWSLVTGLFHPLEICMEKCLLQFSNTYFEQKYNLSFTTSCVNFIATYLENVTHQPGYNAVSMMEHLEDLSEKVLVPSLNSQAFGLTLQYIRNYSVLLWTDKMDRPEVPKNLPELGSLMGNKAIACPLLKRNSTVGFVSAILRLLIAVGKIHRKLVDKLYDLVLTHDEILQYLRKICQLKKSSPAMNYFAKFENNLQYLLLSMAKIKADGFDTKLYHHASMCLLINLHLGEEYIAHDLLSSVIFNHAFLRDILTEMADPASFSERLQLSEVTHISSATGHLMEISNIQLMKEAHENLPSVRATYLEAAAGFIHDLYKSKSRINNPLERESLLSGDAGQLLVPVDWAFFPVIHLYNSTSNKIAGNQVEGGVSSTTILSVTNMLRWVFVMEYYRPGAIDHVSLTIKLSRLMCTFLAGSDLFLEKGVHSHLASLLHQYCKPVHLDRLDFTQFIPGISSFYDLFIMFVNQYEAVSFGDSLFGSYLLIPLQQKHDIMLRKAVWGEYSSVLRSLFIPIKEVLIPLEGFLEPEETDLELLRLYLQCLLSGSASLRWCPLMYLIAIHHINRFMYTTDHKHVKIKSAMLRQVLLCKQEILKKHLLFYKRVKKNLEYGLELYEELPSHRQELISKVNS